VVQQLVDRLDRVRWGLAQFPGGFGDRQFTSTIVYSSPTRCPRRLAAA